VKLIGVGFGFDEIVLPAQKAVKPSFELNIDTVTNWDGSIRFVDRGEIGDRYGGELTFVGTNAKIEELHEFMKKYITIGDNHIGFVDMVADEKPFGAYIDHTNGVIGSITKLSGRETRTMTTSELKITVALTTFTKKAGVSVDFSHEVHGSWSEQYFEELWSLVESQNRGYNYNVSTTDPQKMISADYIFTDADVCGLITHLTTNRGIPIQGRNINKIECVNRIGLKYWQYRIWWV
jgi:hypothetical protein